MRMSCNGCRVLRKGCSEDCSIRPCLQWIKNPESQAHATVFLAKFYGRAGLMNLINGGPEHLRPAIFRSLLYEACGRIVNPIYGSVGLLWSGNWQLCQAAVEAVLKGAPIAQIPSEKVASTPAPPLKDYDIRHVSRDNQDSATTTTAAPSGADGELHKVNKCRSKFKRPGCKPRTATSAAAAAVPPPESEAALGKFVWPAVGAIDFQRSGSHESAASLDASDHGHAADGGDSAAIRVDEESRDNEDSTFSVETAEAASHVSQREPPSPAEDDGEVELELTLGFETVHRAGSARRTIAGSRRCEMSGSDPDTCSTDICLDLVVA